MSSDPEEVVANELHSYDDEAEDDYGSRKRIHKGLDWDVMIRFGWDLNSSLHPSSVRCEDRLDTGKIILFRPIKRVNLLRRFVGRACRVRQKLENLDGAQLPEVHSRRSQASLVSRRTRKVDAALAPKDVEVGWLTERDFVFEGRIWNVTVELRMKCISTSREELLESGDLVDFPGMGVKVILDLDSADAVHGRLLCRLLQAFEIEFSGGHALRSDDQNGPKRQMLLLFFRELHFVAAVHPLWTLLWILIIAQLCSAASPHLLQFSIFTIRPFRRFSRRNVILLSQTRDLLVFLHHFKILNAIFPSKL